jgi:UDPglucose--hexose-1-phosphate uridylyltransferase
MPELRRDPVIGRWVIISTERAKRPDQFGMEVEKEEFAPGEKCPFCEGNESMTPPEICALRKPGTRPNSPGWEVRVVPSITPLLQIEGDLGRHGHGMYDLMNARGAHEILIQTPKHITEPVTSKDILVNTTRVLLDRIADLEKDQRIKYVLIFRNYGKAAGGGHIKHPRIQIIGTPVNLKRVKEELAGAKAYYDYKERCIFCDIIKQELEMQKRIVAETKYFIAIAPFASRFPFETWFLPKEHFCDFYKMDRPKLPDYAELIRIVFTKMRKVIGDFPYNLVLHTAPFKRDAGKKGYWETIEYDYHWHLELLPILTRVAGFEWGSGFYINPLPPEDACKSIREAKDE